MEGPIVRVENVSHRYNVQWAIRDVNLEMRTRGIYGLLGSNGAGKSTLMNILCGVLRQTEGDIFIKGINTKAKSVAAKSLIGFLPQKPPLHMDLTVEEYLYHCAGIRLMPKAEIPEAVERAMTECRILHFRNRLIRNLSGGYQQRVGIAQAIVHSPELIVFDEPTNGLDPNQILDIRNLIKRIAENRTVILSTHMLTEVQAICDHIFMVEEGHMVFSGSIDEFDNYIIPNTVIVSLLDAPAPDVLLEVPGVTKVEELGGSRFRLLASDVNEVIDQMVACSYQNAWRLNEIRVEKSSLNAIFAELSKKSK
ncbi:MAG: ABC transporter ATP-binding protein [Odoribacter sp.]|nr:ABC transporter ATP-binding protein [Odoribacter sp.]